MRTYTEERVPRNSEDRVGRVSFCTRWRASRLDGKGKWGKGTGEVALVGVVVYDFLFRSVRPGDNTARHDDSLST